MILALFLMILALMYCLISVFDAYQILQTELLGFVVDYAMTERL